MLWLLITAGFLHLMLLVWLAWQWHQAPEPELPSGWPALSVVIAARNEAENLKAILPKVLALDYEGDWEVLVVLNNTTDESTSILKDLAGEHAHLRWMDIPQTPPDWSPKKYALSQAIASAKFSNLLLTDADCIPNKGWLKGMGAAFANGATLVLGHSPYDKHPGLLNALVRFETFQTALLYTGFARVGQPYMAVGRNMAYTRAFFESAGGLLAHKDRLSGDDDLLVNHHGSKANCAVLTEPKTHTYSAPPKTWKEWYAQKIRHLSAGSAYGFRSKLFLSLFHGLHAIFYLSLILVLCGANGVLVGGVAYLTRTILVMITLARPANRWKNNAPILLFPLLDPLFLTYQAILTPASIVLKPKWKPN